LFHPLHDLVQALCQSVPVESMAIWVLAMCLQQQVVDALHAANLVAIAGKRVVGCCEDLIGADAEQFDVDVPLVAGQVDLMGAMPNQAVLAMAAAAGVVAVHDGVFNTIRAFVYAELQRYCGKRTTSHTVTVADALHVCCSSIWHRNLPRAISNHFRC
jgi:hypothetical protein